MSSDPSQEGPERSVNNPCDLRLILPDGVQLVARVWTPTQGKGPWPALLMRQPYGRAIASTVTYVHPRWWADQGFLVVVQDVRGQGASEGQFSGFSQEAADTSATLSWIRQRPNCNGRVGLYGFSYQGLTQLLALPDTAPPDCLAPAMTGLDERDHWSCEGGAHWWHLGLGWGLQLAALQARRHNNPEAWEEIRRCLEQNSHCREGLKLLQRHDPNGMVCRWLERSPQDDEAWICHQPPAEWLRRPMLLIGGWWDPHLRGVLDLHRRSLAAGGRPELHIGPASHLQWWPEVQQLHLHFFRRFLTEPASGVIDRPRETSTVVPAVMVWDQCTQQWNAVDSTGSSGGLWQLSGSSLACHAPSEGQLTAGPTSANAMPEATHTAVVIVHDPWRPAPAIGGHLSPNPGPVNRASVDARTDVATFTSEPLTANLQLRGRPSLTITASADQPGFDLCVALSVCPANGSEIRQLSTGVRRVIGAHALQPTTHRVELQALEALLKAGDRLRLSIAGACWPAIAINPGHGDGICGPPNPDCRVISITLNMVEAFVSFEPLIPDRII